MNVVSRRPPRRVWLPALLLWGPLAAVGAWLMVGARFTTTDVGDGAWFIRLVLPSPAMWFDNPAAFVGLVMLVLGVAGWFVALLAPDPRRWPGVAARFPEFAFAGHLLLLVALLSIMELGGHVFDAGTGGVSWRAIAEVRSTANLVVAGVAGALALAAYGFSLGPARWAERR